MSVFIAFVRYERGYEIVGKNKLVIVIEVDIVELFQLATLRIIINLNVRISLAKSAENSHFLLLFVIKFVFVST